MQGKPFRIMRLGSVPYDDALALQTTLLEKRQRGEIPDTILLLEHPHVITLGILDGSTGPLPFHLCHR